MMPECSTEFLSHSQVLTSFVERLKGAEMVVARTDRCDHFDKDVMRSASMFFLFKKVYIWVQKNKVQKINESAMNLKRLIL